MCIWYLFINATEVYKRWAVNFREVPLITYCKMRSRKNNFCCTTQVNNDPYISMVTPLHNEWYNIDVMLNYSQNTRHVVSFIRSIPQTMYSTYIHNQDRSLRWRQNWRDSVSNHQPHDCLLNRLFRCRSKKTSKLRVTGLCAGNSPGTGEFPAQMACHAENVSIWWRHHV